MQLGQLLRTVFLADYFVNEAFRRELLRVLNRRESANALKRAITPESPRKAVSRYWHFWH